jgi:metal-responsive CopG/Arc/MetJ family transcriptional regulator
VGCAPGYTESYTRGMKTAISLPDELFRQANQVARRLKLTRSELFRRALAAFVASSRDAEVTASYNAAFASEEPVEERKIRQRAAKRVLRDVEWTD